MKHVIPKKNRIKIKRIARKSFCAKFYYYHDEENEPRVSICLLQDKVSGKVVARGVAICDRTDEVDKRYGAKLAMRRAWRIVLGRHVDVPVVREDARLTLDSCKCALGKKGVEFPVLTKTEQRLINYL